MLNVLQHKINVALKVQFPGLSKSAGDQRYRQLRIVEKKWKNKKIYKNKEEEENAGK